MDGIVVLHGPDVKAGQTIKGSIVDIAPTVLSAMGLPVPAFMDGTVLQDGFTTGDVARQSIASPIAVPISASDSTNVYSEEDEAQVMERLRDLGYVG